MEHRSIYEQIAGRTDGTVYIGVVGPVRTGKSTFIKRFMEQLVLPNIENVYERERATDELPQSGSGRTIMTAEPKFVPNEAARISPDGKTTLRVRLIDSVGYMIPGAVGDTEDGKPRMVTTPWAPEELPMAQAAELGTKKVMEDHSSLGVVVTTDGTVTDIPREDYREAEARAITDMQKTGKPFVVLVNTQSPGAAPAEALCAQLRSEYGVQALAMDCMHMQTQDIGRLLEAVMYAFPVEELRFFLPSWVRALPDGHPVKAALYDAMLERAGALTSLSEAESVLGTLQELEPVDEFRVREVDLGTGTVSCELHLPQGVILAVIQRGGDTIIPRGDVALKAGDRLVIGAEHLKGDRPVNLREITLRKNHDWNGVAIKDIDISRQSFIVMVRRGKKLIVPYGKLVLAEGDTVILYSKEAPRPTITF